MKIAVTVISLLCLVAPQMVHGQIRATTSTLDLGIVEINTPTVRNLEIENVGSIPLAIGKARLIDDLRDVYSIATNVCGTLAPGERCALAVTLTAKIPGEFTCQVKVPVETAGFPNLTIRVVGRGAGVVNLSSDTLDPVRVWQNTTVAFILRQPGAVTYDYLINAPFQVQRTLLNTVTGEFFYRPDETQRMPFSIVFAAKDARGSVVAEQTVEFQPIPGVNPEVVPAGVVSSAPVPDSVSRDYTFVSNISDETTSDTLNGKSARLRTVTIIGKTLLFEKNSPATLNLSRLLRSADTATSAPSDLRELNLIAETIIVRDSLIFRRTNVNIVAKELVFIDDISGPRACISVEPEAVTPNAAAGMTGKRGFNGSMIDLKIRSFQSFLSDGVTPRIVPRLLAKGGDGQTITSAESSTIMPGRGGDGGTLRVNRFSSDANSIRQFFDAPGGLSGSTSPTVDNRTGTPGAAGGFVLRSTGEYDWVHPSWLRMSMMHLRDAYLLEKWSYASAKASEYKLLLDDVANSGVEFTTANRSEADIADLKALGSEVEELDIRLRQDLDYYGNPLGWAPNLSFEYNLASYQNEIEYAVPALAFIYQVQDRFTVLQNTQTRINAMLDTLSSRQRALTAKFNAMNIDLDSTTIELRRIEQKTIELQARLEQRANELVAQAQSNTKRRGIRRVAQVAGALTQVAAAVTSNKLVGQIGMGLEAASNMEFNGNLVSNALASYKEYQSLEKEWEKSGETLRASLPPEITKALQNPESTDQFPPIGSAFGLPLKNSQIVSKINENMGNIANLLTSMKKLSSAIRTGSAPAHVVEAELARLRASDPEFAALINEIQQLTIRRGLLLAKIDRLIADITFILNELPRLYLAASLLTRDYTDLSAKLDPRIGPYMKEMEKAVRDRLMQYHYYMRKSYEYRFLRPYPYAGNPFVVFDRLRDTVATAGSGTIRPDLLDGMKSLFWEQLKGVASKINADFNTYGTKREPAPQPYTLTRPQVEALNRGDTVTLNLYKLIPRMRTSNNFTNQDVRITKLEFEFEVVSPNAQPQPTPSLKLTAEYPNRFSLSKSGVDYVFLRRSDNPFTWEGEKTGSDEMYYTRTAESEISLLRSLLNTQADIQYFALPAANADIGFYSVLTDRTNAILDTASPVRVLVYYEYLPQSSSERTVFVSTNSPEIAPTMLLSRNSLDVNRRDGHGEVVRSFTPGDVEVHAQEKYGLWHFERWEAADAGTVIQNPLDPVLPLRLTSTRSVRAVYRGPLISVDIEMASSDKEQRRSNRLPVLTYDVNNNRINDTVQIRAYASFLDGRRQDVTRQSTFSIHPNDAGFAEIEQDTIIRLNVGSTAKTDSVRVIARFVNNDQFDHDTVVLMVDRTTSVAGYGGRSYKAELRPNPNPGETVLAFETERDGVVTIRLLDPSGRVCMMIADRFMMAGPKELRIEAPNLSSGRYSLEISTADGSSSIPMVVVR